jgi:hypothetical protein
MDRRLLKISVLLMLGACKNPPQPPCEADPLNSEGSLVSPDDARVDGRLIGWIPDCLGDSCDCDQLPKILNNDNPSYTFNACPLFAVSGADPNTMNGDRLLSCNQPGATTPPPGLAPFCLIEYRASPDACSLKLPSPNEPRSPRISQDPAIVTAPGHKTPAADANVVRTFQDRFREAITPTTLPEGRQTTSVRLAVLDTAPSSSAPSAGGGGHGQALTRLARDLTCGREGCVADITARNALPLRLQPPRETTAAAQPVWSIDAGGELGTLGWLAQAIRREVVANGGDRKLILNLSLGWNPIDMPGELDERTPPPVLAVYAALRDAQCRGAVIFAAAGNRAGECGTGRCDGFLYPAAWSGAPRHATWADIPPADSLPGECQELIGEGPPAMEETSNLLYAVGAFGDGGGPLSLSRPGSRAHLEAWGDHAVLPLGAAAPTDVLTGTSVSTLIVSAAAAHLWATDPSMLPNKLLIGLHQSGVRLEARPDDVLLGLPLEVRGVHICSAIDRDGCSLRSPVPDTLVPALASLAATTTTLSLESQTGSCGPWAAWETAPALTSAAACPFQDLTSAPDRLWLGPQPPEEGCPLCWFNVNRKTLYMQYEPEFVTAASGPEREVYVALTLTGPSGAGATFSVPPPSPLDSPSAVVISGTLPTITSAMLTTTVVDGSRKFTITDEIPLAKP